MVVKVISMVLNIGFHGKAFDVPVRQLIGLVVS